MRFSFLVAMASLISPAMVVAVDWDESSDGDFSGDRLNPTVLALDLGSNNVTMTHQGAPEDIDYFTIQVPAGTVLSSLVLTDFIAEPFNLAFMGMQSGDIFTFPADAPVQSELLGAIVYGEDLIGQDILDDMGAFPAIIGFTPPLPEGNYTIWAQQTGPVSTASLDFQIIEPGEAVPAVSTWGLVWILGGFLTMGTLIMRQHGARLSMN